MHPLQYRDMVSTALKEDLLLGDRASDSIFTTETGEARVISREEGIIAGLPVAREVFYQVDPGVLFINNMSEGERMQPGQCIATVTGAVGSILKGERVALNFLQRLSGIATLTYQAVRETAGTRARIVDTRKTTPGLRVLEKYAVRLGGGENHRFHLADLAMIKDNHIKGAGSIREAVRRVRAQSGFPVKIEVEAATLDDVKEALDAGVDIIMLDNMDVEEMSRAVRLIDGRALVEASGGITAARIRMVAGSGVDLISLGYLTHSARALDIALKLQ